MDVKSTDKTQSAKDIIDYLFVYLLVSLSGNLAFERPVLYLTFVLSAVLFFNRKKHFDVIFLLLLSTVIIILLLQALKFNFFPWFTMAGPVIKLMMAYLIIKSVGSTFMEKYIDIMVVIAIISIVFYLLVGLVPGFSDGLIPYALYSSGEDGSGSHFLGIGTIISGYDPDVEYFRNHGPFWEAGTFGGYLVLALIFHAVRYGHLLKMKSLILMATVLTTVSTTAVLALFLLILSYFISTKRQQYLKFMLVPIVIGIGFASFYEFEFLGKKIEHQAEMIDQEAKINSDTSTRFLDAIRDWRDLEGHELIGRGVNPETRYGKESKQTGLETRTNGITDHLVRYGAIFFLITLAMLYASQLAIIEYYKNVHKEFAIYSTIVILFLLQSEVYFNFPLFFGLMVLYAGYKRKKPQTKNTSKRFMFKKHDHHKKHRSGRSFLKM